MSREDDHTPRHFAGRKDAGGSGTADADVGSGDRPPDEPQPPRPPRSPWILPAVLALVAVGAGAAAVTLDADPTAEAAGIDQVVATPVLSARRAPEAIAAPVADRRLDADLQAWLAASPANTCLVVDNEGREVFDHNPVAPVTGASPPQGGVVAGDLFVVGGGPADLGTTDWLTMGPGTRERVIHDIDGLVNAIAATGITRIDQGL